MHKICVKCKKEFHATYPQLEIFCQDCVKISMVDMMRDLNSLLGAQPPQKLDTTKPVPSPYFHP